MSVGLAGRCATLKQPEFRNRQSLAAVGIADRLGDEEATIVVLAKSNQTITVNSLCRPREKRGPITTDARRGQSCGPRVAPNSDWWLWVPARGPDDGDGFLRRPREREDP